MIPSKKDKLSQPKVFSVATIQNNLGGVLYAQEAVGGSSFKVDVLQGADVSHLRVGDKILVAYANGQPYLLNTSPTSLPASVTSYSRAVTGNRAATLNGLSLASNVQLKAGTGMEILTDYSTNTISVGFRPQYLGLETAYLSGVQQLQFTNLARIDATNEGGLSLQQGIFKSSVQTEDKGWSLRGDGSWQMFRRSGLQAGPEITDEYFYWFGNTGVPLVAMTDQAVILGAPGSRNWMRISEGSGLSIVGDVFSAGTINAEAIGPNLVLALNKWLETQPLIVGGEPGGSSSPVPPGDAGDKLIYTKIGGGFEVWVNHKWVPGAEEDYRVAHLGAYGVMLGKPDTPGLWVDLAGTVTMPFDVIVGGSLRVGEALRVGETLGDQFTGVEINAAEGMVGYLANTKQAVWDVYSGRFTAGYISLGSYGLLVDNRTGLDGSEAIRWLHRTDYIFDGGPIWLDYIGAAISSASGLLEFFVEKPWMSPSYPVDAQPAKLRLVANGPSEFVGEGLDVRLSYLSSFNVFGDSAYFGVNLPPAFSASGQMVVTTAPTILNNMIWALSNKVGINNAEPQAILDIGGPSNHLRLTDNAGSAATLQMVGGFLEVQADQNIQFNPTGGYVVPFEDMQVSLGATNRKFKIVHAEGLQAQQVVTDGNQAVISGHLIIPPSATTLAYAVDSVTTNIYVKDDQFVNGTWVMLEEDGTVEVMKVISTARASEGFYEYDVVRGENGTTTTWEKDTVLLNLGSNFNHGYLYLAATEDGVGPFLSARIRTNTEAWDNIEERAKFGNLNGSYYYNADAYGFAAGDYAATWLSADDTNGFRISNGSTVMGHWDTAGNLTLGNLDLEHVTIAPLGVIIFASGTTQIMVIDGRVAAVSQPPPAEGVYRFAPSGFAGEDPPPTLERFVTGDLNGYYDYIAETWGMAAGDFSGSWLGVDAVNGIRIMNTINQVGQWDISGAITIGDPDESHIYIDADEISLMEDDVTNIQFLTGGSGSLTGTLAITSPGSLTWASGDGVIDDEGLRMYIGDSTAAIGSELLVNGDFNTTDFTGWTAGANWSAATGNAVHTAGSVETLTQSIAVIEGTLYQVTFELSSYSAGYVHFYIADYGWSYISNAASFPLKYEATSSATIPITITPSSDFVGTIASVTVKPFTTSIESPLNIYDENNFSWFETRGNAVLGALAVGRNALRFVTTGQGNTAFGNYALEGVLTANENVAFGNCALQFLQSGSNNVAVGHHALSANFSGSGNIAVGEGALMSVTKNSNVGMGYYAMDANVDGAYNAVIGSYTLGNILSGDSNVAVGYSAGYYQANDVTPLTKANNNIYLGAWTLGKDDTDTNSIVVGYHAVGMGTNTIVLGNASHTHTYLFGNVYLPGAKTIYGGTAANDDLTLEGTSNATKTTSYVILQPATGNVGIGTTSPGAKLEISGSAVGTNTVISITNSAAGGSGQWFGSFQSLAPNMTASEYNYIGWGKAATTNNRALLDYYHAGDGSTSNRIDFGFYGAANLLSILAGGNVGIGTTSPGALLQVGQGTPSGTPKVALFGGGSAVFDWGNTSSLGRLSYSGSNVLINSAANMIFGTNSISNVGTTMYLSTSGNVGIGTTGPDRLLHAESVDAVTNAVTYAQRLSHITSGTAAAGFGTGVEFEIEDDAGTNRVAGYIESLWNSAATASYKGDLVLKAVDSGGTREGLRIRGSGTAPLLGVLGATPVARIAHVADPSGGATVDAEARTAINAILTTLENFGFHATA